MIDILELARLGVAKKYSQDEVFFHEGDPGEEMFIILKGRVAIFVNSLDGAQVKISELGAGRIFGEMSLLEDLPRSASIVALEETIVITLNRSNFSSIISQQPQLAFRIMKDMSSRIRQLNEDIIHLREFSQDNSANQGQEPLLTNSMSTPLYIDIDFPNPQSSSPPVSASPELEQYLFDKEQICPVCGQGFIVKLIRSSRLRLKKLEPDLRQRFEDIEPLWFMMWVCPHCYYASFNYEFKQVNPEVKKYIMAAGQSLKSKYGPLFSHPRQLNEVFQSYYLYLDILLNSGVKDTTRIAKAWLRLSWLYQDHGDNKMYRYSSSQALEYFQQSYYRQTRYTSLEQEQRLALLMGELSMRIESYEEARNLFRQAIVRKGGNIGINRQAEDRIQEIKSLVAKLVQDSST